MERYHPKEVKYLLNIRLTIRINKIQDLPYKWYICVLITDQCKAEQDRSVQGNLQRQIVIIVLSIKSNKL